MVRDAFAWAFERTTPIDPVIVGMFHLDKSQVQENCQIVRELFG